MRLACIMARLVFALVLLTACVLSVRSELCPQAGLHTDAWVKEVVAKLMSFPTNSNDRVDYLRVVLANDTRAFSGPQTVSILQDGLLFAGDIEEAMPFFGPYVVGLQASEVVQVVEGFIYENLQALVLTALKDTLLNASSANKQYIATNVFYGEDQETALRILQNALFRDCIFGTVTESSVIFMVDISESMGTPFTLNSRRYTRLSYVQEHLARVIQGQLQPHQQFNIILFNDGVHSCFTIPVNATSANIEVALAFLLGWEAEGSTANTYKALSTVFSSSPNAAVAYFVSDSLPESFTANKIISALLRWNAQRAPDRQIKIYSTAPLLGYSTDKQQTATFALQVAAATKGVSRYLDQ